MAEDTLIPNLSEAEQFVVLEHVFEYISDVATLASLTLVSKRARSAIYRSNGLREITFTLDIFSGEKLNEVPFGRGSTEENSYKEILKNSVRWLWAIGKRLKTVRLVPKFKTASFYDLISVLSSLAMTEKRRIETIVIATMPCEMALDLVKENRNTLRCLRVELWDEHNFFLIDRLQNFSEHYYLSELPKERKKFWSVVQQCERLRSLDLSLSGQVCIPTELWNVLYSLESLKLDYCIFGLIFNRLTNEMSGPRLSAGYMNVKKLTFAFLRYCCEQNPINWSVFWAIFPALNEIKDNSDNSYICEPDCSILWQNVVSFCKTFLEVSANQSRELKIEIRPTIDPHGTTRSRVVKLIAAVAMVATLLDDQAWYVSHGVQIETEMSDQKIQRVTLRKDTSTLVFDFKYPDD